MGPPTGGQFIPFLAVGMAEMNAGTCATHNSAGTFEQPWPVCTGCIWTAHRGSISADKACIQLGQEVRRGPAPNLQHGKPTLDRINPNYARSITQLPACHCAAVAGRVSVMPGGLSWPIRGPSQTRQSWRVPVHEID